MKCEPCKIGIPVFLVIIASFIIAYQFVEPPPPKEIRIATGREGGGYHQFALKYQQLMAKEHFQLEIIPTAGSVEVLQLLKTGQADIGLVQGGTGKTVSPEGLESIASLFYEPLWIFHRQEQPFEYLFEFRGKRLAVGEEGSGTRPVAEHLLQDNHVTPENSSFLGLSSREAAAQLIAGEIDAAFFVMSPTANLITELLMHPKIELMNLRRDQAYSSRYSFLTSLKIGEGMIDLEKNIPDQDKTLLAATASLVARDDLHSDVIHLLLKKLIEVHKDGGMLEKPDQFPSEQFVEFPMNEAAAVYLKNGPSWLHTIFPFWIASTLDRLKILLIPLIPVVMILFKGAFPLYRLGIRFKIFRWYGTLREIDREIDEHNDLATIEDEIQKMKTLQKEIIEQVSVPLSYMGEFYALRLHIRLVLNRLREQREEILAGALD
jgi:TRAP transporter TAXI family solute receptor